MVYTTPVYLNNFILFKQTEIMIKELNEFKLLT